MDREPWSWNFKALKNAGKMGRWAVDFQIN